MNVSSLLIAALINNASPIPQMPEPYKPRDDQSFVVEPAIIYDRRWARMLEEIALPDSRDPTPQRINNGYFVDFVSNGSSRAQDHPLDPNRSRFYPHYGATSVRRHSNLWGNGVHKNRSRKNGYH